MGATSIASERLELVELVPDAVDALLGGRRRQAEALAGIRLPEGWPDEHDAAFLKRRADGIRRDPSLQEWSLRAVALREAGRPMVGHTGFHGPPGANGPKRPGALEIGYTIFEAHRGRGFATEAAGAMIGAARAAHGILHFIASVAPDNAASLAVVRKLGFVQAGEQMDEEHGRELVFELIFD